MGLKQHWNTNKTLQQNMNELGLAFNVNESIKKQQRRKPKDNDDDDDEMVTADYQELKVVNNTAVIEEFERQAQIVKKCERHISPDEAKFLMSLMKDHWVCDYSGMCRDKRNTYQHTASKLKFKCEALIASPLYQRYKEL